ncbi:phosphotransferase enzyme family protein [Plastorhodobacter daqingensis]|uniref:Phosphotransferase enzyme family protein n=1 Tax=Plastorhodobacter daqingensis TaxID=1387281 RepID=A0ABW2UR15_9RHOB
MRDDTALAQAHEAMAAWGGTGTPRLIRNRENAVFEIITPAGRAALRLHRQGYQTEAAIRSELWWMRALADRAQPVPHPLRTATGALTHCLQGGRIASALAWVEGAPLGAAGIPLSGTAQEQAAQHHALGRLLATVHSATDRLEPPQDFERPHWDLPGLLGESPLWGRFWEHPGLAPAEARLLVEARAFCAEATRDATARGADQGLVHADVLRENVLLTENGPVLIDFDDCGRGFRLYDLGTALSQNLSEPHLPAILAALVDGYASLRPLAPEDQALIPVMTLMRCLASVGWTMTRIPQESPLHRSYINRATRLSAQLLRGEGLVGKD